MNKPDLTKHNDRQLLRKYFEGGMGPTELLELSLAYGFKRYQLEPWQVALTLLDELDRLNEE